MKYIIVILLVFTVSCSIFKDKDSKSSRKKIYVASVQKGLGGDSISPAKFQKAMNVAAMLSGKYELISPQKVDSVILYYNNKGVKPQAIDIAEDVDADNILFAKVNRLHNMLRVDLTLINTDNTDKSSTGKGYDLMNFLDLQTNNMLLDPSLLTATQRAFADAVKDTLLYDTLDGRYRVYPSPVMVISGLAYVGMVDSTDWKIFNDRVISSYDACETIFEQARQSNEYVVYDLETRDSIYAMFNLFGIENYMPPTNIEIETLRKLEVDNFISGRLEFLTDSIEIELYNFKITKSGQKLIREAKGTISEDNTETLRKKIKKLVIKLLNQQNE